MADQPRRLNTYRQVVGARVARRDEAQAAGFRGRAYVLETGGVVSRRQLEQRAFRLLGLDYRTLEERSSRMRLEHPPGSYVAAARFWANKESISFREATRDPRFKGIWATRRGGVGRGSRRGQIARAYESLGIIHRTPAGGYEYTEDFMRYWMRGGFEAVA